MKLQRIVFLLLSAAVLWCIAAPEAGTAASAPSEIAESCRDIALTFDDGPRADTTGKLLDGLKARGVHATFFLIGNQIDANAALVQRMKAEGHQVGNHTWDHTKLQGTSTYVLAQEVAKTNAKLCSLWEAETIGSVRPTVFWTSAKKRCFRFPSSSGRWIRRIGD